MPTGYTAGVADGSIADLKTFALQLARGMGALIMMRDDPSDAKIPERFEPGDYNAKELAKLRGERDRIRAMSDDEAQAAADAEYTADQEAQQKYFAEKDEQRARYEAMLAKVRAWQGAPEGIKEFGIEQLTSSIDFDCSDERRWYRPPVERDGKKWRAAKLEKISKDVEYHAAEQGKEEARTEGRNAWLAQLRRSLDELAQEAAQ